MLNVSGHIESLPLTLLVDIGFLNFGLLDIIDIAIVSFLFYRVYKLLRGSVAFNIFLGLITLYLVWWFVNALNMQLLSTILSRFASVGVILLIVVFQPEIRSFLLDLGQTTFGNRLDIVRKWLNLEKQETNRTVEPVSDAVYESVRELRSRGYDALIILNSGEVGKLKMDKAVMVNADFNRDLLYSVFHPEAELRNGAAVLESGKIKAVAAKFPYSESAELPEETGMRHRHGLGATEVADVGAVIISGANRTVSTAYQGYLAFDIADSELKRFIKAHT